MLDPLVRSEACGVLSTEDSGNDCIGLSGFPENTHTLPHHLQQHRRYSGSFSVLRNHHFSDLRWAELKHPCTNFVDFYLQGSTA